MSTLASDVPVAEVRHLSKSFPGVMALQDVSVGFRAGTVHALVGENGAGKSTLIKTLAGVYPPDAGDVFVDGAKVSVRSPHHSQTLGMAFIHQEPALVPAMSVAENMTLGLRGNRRAGVFVNWRSVHRQARQIADRLRLDVDVKTPVSALPPAQRELVALGRALLLDARMVVLDEPTASLTNAEIEVLFAAIRDLVAAGVAVVYVSHRLGEIFAIADTVTVLKDGKHIITAPTATIASRHQLVQYIVGAEAADEFEGRPSPVVVERGEQVLKVSDLSWRDRVHDVSFEVCAGEIVGIGGLVGAGRSELAHVLFGAERPTSGQLEIAGARVRFRSPRQAIRAGMALVPEDRRHQGAVMSMSVRENATLANLGDFQVAPWFPFLAHRAERAAVQKMIVELGVRTPGSEQTLAFLSGGNQQKVIIGKWLQNDARLFIFDEPTQGIDIGAKQEIHQLVRQLAANGAAVIVISSELEELVSLAPRVLVMREGRIVADLERPDEATVLADCYGTDDPLPTSA